MVVPAWISVTQLKVRPSYVRDTTLMPGDNMSAVHWFSKCPRRDEAPVGGIHVILEMSEGGVGWWFDALHVARIDNSMADGILR